jgi:hypothetical protein
MQHEAALSIHRPALEHLHAAGTGGKLDEVGGRNHIQLHEQVGKADVGRRLVDNDAHRPFGRMGADIDHTAGETFIAHAWHRDEHLPVEIAALCALARLRLCSGRSFLRELRHVCIAAGRSCSDVTHAWFAAELHVEMLPDWVPIANVGFVKVSRWLVSRFRSSQVLAATSHKHSLCHNSPTRPSSTICVPTMRLSRAPADIDSGARSQRIQWRAKSFAHKSGYHDDWI